jgi:putative ABC transport system ATP-binding protein
MGIVFQQYHLLPHLTALENVSLPLEIRSETVGDRAQELLCSVGLGHRLHHMPSQLSGGECQRVAIARALVVRPEMILADEPSGNLDQKTGEQVMDIFFKLVREHRMTTLLVTHNQQLTQFCDRVFRLEEGQLREDLK